MKNSCIVSVISKCASITCWAVLILTMSERPARAMYVDPGSGVLALQVITSTIVGVLLLIRARVRTWFARCLKALGSRNRLQ